MPRNHQALDEEAADNLPSRERSWAGALFSESFDFLAGPQPAAFLRSRAHAFRGMLLKPQTADAARQLLRSKALTEVESAGIRLCACNRQTAADAKLQLDKPATPLIGNYHERLGCGSAIR